MMMMKMMMIRSDDDDDDDDQKCCEWNLVKVKHFYEGKTDLLTRF